MADTPDSHRTPLPSQKPRRGWRGWFYFGPDAGIHAWLAADLTVVVIASFLASLYAWVDKPGPSDLGRQTLSGWLVRLFGVTLARAGGTALFLVLGLVLLGALIAYGRWMTGPFRERRRLRRVGRS